ncbi:unnamed protein product [Umbelopsis ramanniana]
MDQATIKQDDDDFSPIIEDYQPDEEDPTIAHFSNKDLQVDSRSSWEDDVDDSSSRGIPSAHKVSTTGLVKNIGPDTPKLGSLLACNALSCSPRVQDNCVLAAKIGKLKPIFLTSSNGKIYPFLAASENIIDVLSDEPTGTWSLPTVKKAAPEGFSLPTNTDDLLKHIISTSPICRHIANQQYVELSREITRELNKD